MKIEFEHISVLADQVVDFAPQASQSILDCTLGGGGHSKRLLEKFPAAILYGIDRDAKALNAAAESLKNYKEEHTNLYQILHCLRTALQGKGICVIK